MALIKCPACGKEISDKASACVGCGHVLQELPEQNAEEPADQPEYGILCKECGMRIYDENAAACPSCGAPVELSEEEKTVKEEKAKKKKRGKLIGVAIAAVATVVVIVAIVFGVNMSNQTQSYNDYVDSYNKAISDMVSGGADAESVTNTAKKVWHAAIFEKKLNSWDKDIQNYYATDFNEALAKMYKDSKWSTKVTAIKENQKLVEADMQKIQGAPDEFKNAYGTISDLYDTYLKFTNLAISPTGNINSFSSNVNDLDSAFVSEMKKAQQQIPQKKQ